MSVIEVRDLIAQRRAHRDLKPRVGGVMSIREALKHHKAAVDGGVDATWLRIQLQSIIDGRDALIGPYTGVDGAWRGQPCFLVGGSRGLRNAMDEGFRLDMLDGFHSIGVNHVVEDYHRFEWLFFLDERFPKICKFDIMREYRGRMFVHIRTRLKPSKRVTVIYTQNDGPAEHIVQGLYSFIVSGVTAINLALVSGANPIYLLGLDNGGLAGNKNGSHYRDDYTGERKGGPNWAKFKTKIPEKLLRYANYADRFVNVDPLGDITVFRKMGIRDVPELQGRFA